MLLKVLGLVLVLGAILDQSEGFYRPSTGLVELSEHKGFMDGLKWLLNLSDDPEEVLNTPIRPKCLVRPFSKVWMDNKCWEGQKIRFIYDKSKSRHFNYLG